MELGLSPLKHQKNDSGKYEKLLWPHKYFYNQGTDYYVYKSRQNLSWDSKSLDFFPCFTHTWSRKFLDCSVTSCSFQLPHMLWLILRLYLPTFSWAGRNAIRPKYRPSQTSSGMDWHFGMIKSWNCIPPFHGCIVDLLQDSFSVVSGSAITVGRNPQEQDVPVSPHPDML